MSRGSWATNCVRLLTPGLLLTALAGCIVTERTGGPMAPAADQDRLAAHLAVASGYLQVGETQRARLALHRATLVDADAAGVLLLYAALYEMEGEFALAEQWYRRALEQSPDDARVNNNYGAFLYGRGRFADSIPVLEVASANPEYANRSQALMNLGLAALRVPDQALALKALTRAVGLDSALGVAHLEVAGLLAGMGDYQAAWVHYDQFRRQVRPSARSLLMGIRISRGTHDAAGEAALARQLHNLFPDSPEQAAYQRML